MTYHLTYRINNHDLSDPVRHIEVEAEPEQIHHLVEQGYMVRERLFSGEELDRLRDAADELIRQAGGERAACAGGNFGGLFVRNLPDRHPVFIEMLRCGRLLSVARAVLGPQVQLHGSVIRVTYPGQPDQETHWHFHQRVIPNPLPPLAGRPRVLDHLIYLDDIDEATGPLCVVPGSHLRLHDELRAGDFSDLTGQVVLPVPAGSCVTADAGLWHRARPTRPDGRVRRLVIWGYSPTWMKQVDRPGGRLTDPLLEPDDPEMHELLGQSGWY